jgi:hypothetical protein
MDFLRALFSVKCHGVCPHESCLAAILQGTRNGLYYGAKVRFPHALVMTFLFKRDAPYAPFVLRHSSMLLSCFADFMFELCYKIGFTSNSEFSSFFLNNALFPQLYLFTLDLTV